MKTKTLTSSQNQSQDLDNELALVQDLDNETLDLDSKKIKKKKFPDLCTISERFIK